MNRELEQELLSCPIGELLEFDDDNAASSSGLEGTNSCYDHSGRNMNWNGVVRALPTSMPTASILPPCEFTQNNVLHLTSQSRSSSFIDQVLRILNDAQLYNFEHIVSWQPDGLSFKVHKIHDFETQILPRYLEQTKVRSFQRQLIKHGFERIQGGASRGAYSHPKFIRSDPKSCLSIEKVKRNRASDEAGSTKDSAVKLVEMSDHFRQAVQESQPVKMKSRCHQKEFWSHPMSSEIIGGDRSSSIEMSLESQLIDRIEINEQSFSWMDNDCFQAPKPDLLPVHRRSNSTINSTGNCFDLRVGLGKCHSSPGQIEGMCHSLHRPRTFGSQKILLSKYLPIRLPPGSSDLDDLDSVDLLSDITEPSKIDLQVTPTNFSSPNAAVLSTQKDKVTGPFPFRMASSLFDQSSDIDGDFWQL